MLQLLLFLSARISNLGDSVCRLAHGILVLILFSRTPNFKFTPTLPASPRPSLLLDAPTASPEPFHSWPPQISDGLSVTDKWSEPFLAQQFQWYRSALAITDNEEAQIINPLTLLLVLVLIYMSFGSDLNDLFAALLSWVHSTLARLSASFHAECSVKVRLIQTRLSFHGTNERTQLSCKVTELAEKCNALDIALQQIEQGSARIQSLSVENYALSNLAIEQGTDIRMQSDLITEFESQLRDQRCALEQAVIYCEQHERDSRVHRQEVARLEERMAIHTAESDLARSALHLNFRAAHTREGRLRDILHANEMLLSETRSALRISEESSHTQQELLSLELGVCIEQREHWKAVAEQAETKVLDADRAMLNLRKELAIAFKNARETKERFENQTIVLGEREATIRFLDHELVDIRDQLQNAKDEIDDLRSDLEPTTTWKSLVPADGLLLTDELPPLQEWCGWPTKDTPDAPAMSAPLIQHRTRSPEMSIGELISVNSPPCIPASPVPLTEILCSTNSIICSAELDDPFLVNPLPQPRSPLGSPPFSSREASAYFSTSVSPIRGSEIIDELREQLASEQLARAHAERQLTLQQLKALATEAVVVVLRRQLLNQQSQLSKQTAKNASLREELRSLELERSSVLAQIALLEASLAEYQMARISTAKAMNDAHAELIQAKEILFLRANEADTLKMERDTLDMRLSQAMLLSSALQERVIVLEQRVANVTRTSSESPSTAFLLCRVGRAELLSIDRNSRRFQSESGGVSVDTLPSRYLSSVVVVLGKYLRPCSSQRQAAPCRPWEQIQVSIMYIPSPKSELVAPPTFTYS